MDKKISQGQSEDEDDSRYRWDPALMCGVDWRVIVLENTSGRNVWCGYDLRGPKGARVREDVNPIETTNGGLCETRRVGDEDRVREGQSSC